MTASVSTAPTDYILVTILAWSCNRTLQLLRLLLTDLVTCLQQGMPLLKRSDTTQLAGTQTATSHMSKSLDTHRTDILVKDVMQETGSQGQAFDP